VRDSLWVDLGASGFVQSTNCGGGEVSMTVKGAAGVSTARSVE
jgi:hypothetical protein